MKSLRESLFDDDLVTKKIPTFGDYYKVDGVFVRDEEYDNGGWSQSTKEDDYKWLVNTIRVPELKKDFKKPVEINNNSKSRWAQGWSADKQFRDTLGWLIAAMNELPADLDDKFAINVRDLKSGLSKYFKNLKSKSPENGGNYYMMVNGKGDLSFEIYRKNYRCTINFVKK